MAGVTMISTALLKPGLVAEEEFQYIYHFLLFITILVSLAGIITNAINIWTFISIGVKDGVTLTLMGLAISDFEFAFCVFLQSVATIFVFYESWINPKGFPISPRVVIVICATLSLIPYQVTCMTTTFISVARCLCIAMPFKFKDFFTKSRSIYVLIIFHLFAPIFYAPTLYHTGTKRQYDPSFNKTRIILWFSSERSKVLDITKFSNFFMFTLVSCSVVTFCIIIIAKHLRQSTQFRNRSTVGSVVDNDAKKADDKLSGKELQVMRQIVVLCIIYAVSMLPSIFITVYRFVDEDFELSKRLHRLYVILNGISALSKQINSATTFLVYFIYNSKFRVHFLSCCSLSNG